VIVYAIDSASDRLDDDRKSDARDQGNERPGVPSPKRRKRNPVENDAGQAGCNQRGDESEQQRISGEDDAQTNERAEHEDRRVREIQDIENAEDQRVTDCKERVCRSEEDSVGELLG
jgi:hypothetical protein